jgi:hypothetical protein
MEAYRNSFPWFYSFIDQSFLDNPSENNFFKNRSHNHVIMIITPGLSVSWLIKLGEIFIKSPKKGPVVGI